MRVIAGKAKGKRIITPDGLDVRPTIDRVKEAVFSSLQFELEGRRVLDLFAGSGQLGIEAISRGAKSCVFVDGAEKSLNATNTNIKNCGFEAACTVVSSDSFSFLDRNDKVFDIAFLDPPYNKGLIDKAMLKLVLHMSDYGVIVCEHCKEDVLAEHYGDFVKTKTAKYGIVYVSYYRKAKD